MDINERVKIIRKELNLTQKEFGSKIAVAQSYLTNIENGLRPVTDKIIKLICTVFNVNEEWLRNGTGEMFIDPDTFVLEEYAKSRGASDFEIALVQKFVKNYFSWPEEVRNLIISTFKESLNSDENAATKEEIFEDYKEKELANYALELDAEQQGKTLSVSEKREGA